MVNVSVIVPVYNVQDYLEICLNSLANQKLADVEFILIDDGSTDRSSAICDNRAAMDHRFRVIHQKNGGVSAARNQGLLHARGEYIAFVDADDWLEPNSLEYLYTLLQENPHADIACGGYCEYLSDPAKKPLVRPDSAKVHHGCVERETAFFNVMLRDGYFTAIWNKMFRRSAIWKNGTPHKFDPDLGFGEDEKWLLELMLDCKYCVFSPEVIYHWRNRPESASRQTVVTPKSESILSAKRGAIEIVRTVSADLAALAQSRLYNDTFYLQVQAYHIQDRETLHRIRKKQQGTWLSWILSHDVPPLRKAKTLTVRFLMLLHFPKK